MTNARLTKYNTEEKFRDIICKTERTRGRKHITTYVDKLLMIFISDLYYNAGSPAGFSTVPKLRAARLLRGGLNLNRNLSVLSKHG